MSIKIKYTRRALVLGTIESNWCYRRFEFIIEAITEEKRIKAGSRKKKEDLINGMYAEWKDLYDEIKYL